jgi:hypothetical protein
MRLNHAMERTPNASASRLAGRDEERMRDEWSDGMSDIEGKAARGAVTERGK